MSQITAPRPSGSRRSGKASRNRVRSLEQADDRMARVVRDEESRDRRFGNLPQAVRYRLIHGSTFAETGARLKLPIREKQTPNQYLIEEVDLLSALGLDEGEFDDQGRYWPAR